MDGCFQALSRARFGHGFAGYFQRGQKQALTSSRHMRKESVLNRIMLRTTGRVVSDADFQADAVRQTFQMVFEHIAVGGVAAAAIATKQQSARVGIGKPSLRFPPVAGAVAGEPTGVVAEA